MPRGRTHLIIDCIAIGVSICIAVGLLYTGTLHALLTETAESRLIGTLVAGFFFTSVFTTAPAIVALGEITATASLWQTAVVGALGATCGDLILFRFIRDRVGDDIGHVLRARGRKRYPAIVRNRLFRGFTMFLGALVIASPLPDELGLLMMGLPRMPLRVFMLVSFTMNAFGIFMIGLVARAVT